MPAGGEVDREVVRSLADIFVDYGHGYITPGLLAWSPGWVAVFLGDWQPRKTFLDDAQREVLPEALRRWVRFALNRARDRRRMGRAGGRGGRHLPSRFPGRGGRRVRLGPAKQIAAGLTARGSISATRPPLMWSSAN